MPEPYVGEIRAVAFNFAPRGWALCDGQLLSVAQNTALFSILGTTYGGDGRTTFALPDLRGRVPLHFSGSIAPGMRNGETTHTLTVGELSPHHHAVLASSKKGQTNPADQGLASAAMYAAGVNPTAALATGTDNTGGSQPHDNMQPYLTINFIIALEGLFPSRG